MKFLELVVEILKIFGRGIEKGLMAGPGWLGSLPKWYREFDPKRAAPMLLSIGAFFLCTFGLAFAIPVAMAMNDMNVFFG